jgi:hypothetical protein
MSRDSWIGAFPNRQDDPLLYIDRIATLETKIVKLQERLESESRAKPAA